MKKRVSDAARWMTFAEVAEQFGVSEATVRLGRGVFGRLRRVPLSARRVVIARSDVERLDRDMERAAIAPVASIEERRRRA